MDDSVRSGRAFLLAGVVFLTLLSVTVLTAFLFDFSHFDVHALLLVAALTLSFLVAKLAYDVATERARVASRAERLARELVDSSEQLFTVVYYNSPVPYILIDSAGKVVSANRAALRLFGVSEEHLQGFDIFPCIETANPEHTGLLKDRFENGISVDGEEVYLHIPEEGGAWVLLSIYDFVDGAGRTLGLLTLVDITRQKAIDQAKSEFVSLASHQLRTPITGMRWSAELLLMDTTDPLSPKQQQYVNRLLESIRRMGTLVNDFLNVSRLELGTLAPQASAVELAPLFEEVLEEQQVQIAEHSITVERRFDPALVEIVTDEDLLRMVITNLVSNAVKYTRTGGSVAVGYERQGDEIIITVADTGMGIPAAEQEHIFEKIYRASNAAKEVPDGTGLGLYIVKETVRVLRGSVSFTSAENVGTTFTVRLPITL